MLYIAILFLETQHQKQVNQYRLHFGMQKNWNILWWEVNKEATCALGSEGESSVHISKLYLLLMV